MFGSDDIGTESHLWWIEELNQKCSLVKITPSNNKVDPPAETARWNTLAKASDRIAEEKEPD